MVSRLRLSEQLSEVIITSCKAALPHEACGMLAGQGREVMQVFPITNTDPSPVSFFMDPTEQFRAMKEMRQKGLQMIGIYHSHPVSPAYPSSTDVRLAFYSDVVYVIVGLADPLHPEARGFTICDGIVREVGLEIV